MIVGIGTDLVDIRRIEALLVRHGARFLQRVFSPQEIAQSLQAAKGEGGVQKQAALLAKRFAAKEATLKALGTGLRHGIRWQDMDVRNDMYGAPEMRLSRKAKEAAEKRMPPGHKPRLHLSLSDEFPYAQAFVVLEANG